MIPLALLLPRLPPPLPPPTNALAAGAGGGAGGGERDLLVSTTAPDRHLRPRRPICRPRPGAPAEFSAAVVTAEECEPCIPDWAFHALSLLAICPWPTRSADNGTIRGCCTGGWATMPALPALFTTPSSRSWRLLLRSGLTTAFSGALGAWGSTPPILCEP